jgi:hypothetical protein
VILLDLVGAALTLVTLAFLFLGGLLLALRLLRAEALADPLALSIAALVLATGQAVLIGLVLGVLGVLRLELALALQAGLVLVLLKARGGAAAALAEAARTLGRRTWARLAEHPALALIAAHAAGSELLRGLLRPPLSWDSLMSHLLLAATWLQDRGLTVVSGAHPVNYFGHQPGNGSLWFWWWLAPSHSELYVNLASLPHWLLFGLAAGAVARELGAVRHWPFAAYALLLLPAVVRFVAAQYVDLFLGSLYLAGAFFGLRWLRRAALSDAVLAGVALGCAAGGKVLGPPYVAALALGLALAGLAWRSSGVSAARRLGALAVAGLLVALLGSYFFVRNITLGVGATGIACAGTGEGADAVSRELPRMPRKDSVLDLIGRLARSGDLLDTFLGISRPVSLELGLGPPFFALLAAGLLFPWALGPERRRAGWVLWAQVVVQAAFWLAVPYANNNHIFANVRYLLPAVGIACAGAVAAAEWRGVGAGWVQGIVLLFSIQGLLQLHSEMPRQVRIALGLVDLAAVILALSPALRRGVHRRWPLLAGAGVLAALLAVPSLSAFRVADRGRAFAREYTTHLTSTRFFAGGWSWLDAYGGDGTVAVSSNPGLYFVYPAMGPHLERRAVYVNVNEADRPASGYPKCEPRVDFSPAAWVRNLERAGARWVLFSRFPEFPFPVEAEWARARPDLFVLRHVDNTNLVFEIRPGTAAAPPGGVR